MGGVTTKRDKGDNLNLPQFDGHFKMYTLEVEGVSNEKKKPIHTRV
jgi:hypothetical protein